MKLNVAMAIDGNIGVLTMNTANSIVRTPIKVYIDLLTLTIVKINVRSPMQFSTTKSEADNDPHYDRTDLHKRRSEWKSNKADISQMSSRLRW